MCYKLSLLKWPYNYSHNVAFFPFFFIFFFSSKTNKQTKTKNKKTKTKTTTTKQQQTNKIKQTNKQQLKLNKNNPSVYVWTVRAMANADSRVGLQIKTGHVARASHKSSGAAWKSRWTSWAPVPNSQHDLCGRKATLTSNLNPDSMSEVRCCVKVEVDILGSPSLIVCTSLCGLYRMLLWMSDCIVLHSVRSWTFPKVVYLQQYRFACSTACATLRESAAVSAHRLTVRKTPSYLFTYLLSARCVYPIQPRPSLQCHFIRVCLHFLIINLLQRHFIPSVFIF